MSRIKSKIYAQALVDIILNPRNRGEVDIESIIKNFLKLLEKNGDIRKAKEIIFLAEEIFIKKTGRRKIIIETARKIKSKQKELIESIKQKGDIVYEKINEKLIAGIKIIVNDKQLDYSMKNKLNNIFK